jgi:hypothetical protein
MFGGMAAVRRNPHLPHLQYVSPHLGHMSPENLSLEVQPQLAHSYFSIFLSILSPKTIFLLQVMG